MVVSGFKVVKDNRKLIIRSIEKGLMHGMENMSDTIGTTAAGFAPKKSGDLVKSILQKATSAQSFQMIDTKTVKQGGKWVEIKEYGDWIDVPPLEAKKDKSGFICPVGAYAPYAAAVEYGTTPHEIKPKAEGTGRNDPHLRFKVDSEIVYTKRAWHPGTDAQPFMRPAVDSIINSPKAGTLITDAIHKELGRSPSGKLRRTRDMEPIETK